MLLILRSKIENWSNELSRKLWNTPGIKYGVLWRFIEEINIWFARIVQKNISVI